MWLHITEIERQDQFLTNVLRTLQNHYIQNILPKILTRKIENLAAQIFNRQAHKLYCNSSYSSEL